VISTDQTTVPTRLRHLILALAIPLFLGAGVALSYLGAFHDPTPRHLRVEIATTSPASTAPLVSALATRVGQQFEISVRSPTQAAADVAAARVAAAYRQGTKPQLLVNTAASPTAEQAAVQLFTTVAATTEHAPLSVHDFGPQPANDPLSQNLFFLLVALTIGGYSGAVAIGAAGERLPARTRAGIAVAMAGVIALLGVLIAGPLYGAVHGHLPELAAIAWLYVSGVMLIGTGLHAFLGRLTTPALVGLFVMLNFTTSGGVYDPALQSSFFRALSHVWNGDAFIAATRDVLYRSGTGTTAAITRLAIWALAGLALTAIAIWRENHHAHPLAAPARTSEEHELEQLIVAA
jgi:hypothetical protein